MRNFDEATITDAVLQRVRAAKGRAMTQPYYHLNYDFGRKTESKTSHAGERAA
jgi:hypothetical protein